MLDPLMKTPRRITLIGNKLSTEDKHMLNEEKKGVLKKNKSKLSTRHCKLLVVSTH